MKLAYRAVTQSGQAESGVIDASTIGEAKERLRRDGLFVTEVSDAAKVRASSKDGSLRWGLRGKRLVRVADFARHLQVLLTADTPLVEAIAVVERQARQPEWAEALADVRKRIEEGATLADALRSQPQWFNTVTCSLVAAGESGGNLPDILARLAALTRKQIHLRNQLVGAMAYPAMVMILLSGVLTVLMLFVVPRFGKMFTTLDAALPPTTRFLLWCSNMLWAWGWLIPIVVVVGFIVLRNYLRSEAGRAMLDARLIRLPWAGPMIRGVIAARIARLLGVLVGCSVPLLEAIDLTRAATANRTYAALLDRAHEAAAHGEPLSSVFSNESLIAPSVYEAIRNGESSGRLGQLLANIADMLDEDNEVVVRSLTQVLGPAVLVVLGLFVGFVALSLFIPLFDLTAATGSG